MESLLEHKTLTFQEVHETLERENSLLLKEHNIQDFSKKSEFLNALGFTNSKATKMYSAIVNSEEYRKDFNRRYNGMYKFILKEQLERVCERYNLFVRPLRVFAGDIPEKNIKDMMDFKFYITDLITLPFFVLSKVFTNNLDEIKNSNIPNIGSLIFHDNVRVDKLDREILTKMVEDRRSEIENLIFSICKVDVNKKYSLSEIETVRDSIFKTIADKYYSGDTRTLRQSMENRFSQEILSGRLEIAAVASLFLPDAFYKDDSRLGNERTELRATGQVDLDPIVMLKNNHGYIIITAWGDEANDELIVNQNLN
jgi:hypothetical protein